MVDQLTGLANRRRIESLLEFQLIEMKRFKIKFCVVFLDIDDFSKFNNTYGHDLGDAVLKTISKSVMHSVRKTDLFGRWGGEEFIGIYEIQEDNDALIIAEKIRVLIANSQIAYNKESLSVTASIGVTAAKTDDTMDSIVKRADSLMYKSKQSGKNRVTSDAR